jgi:hypothetical protein
MDGWKASRKTTMTSFTICNNFIQNVQNVNFWQCGVGFKLGYGMVHTLALIGFVLNLALIVLNLKHVQFNTVLVCNCI